MAWRNLYRYNPRIDTIHNDYEVVRGGLCFSDTRDYLLNHSLDSECLCIFHHLA